MNTQQQQQQQQHQQNYYYQQQHPQQQQQQYPQQHYPQQYPNQPPQNDNYYTNPTAATATATAAAAQIMMMNPSAWESVGTQVFSTGQNYVEQTMKNADVWNRFRYYWNVDNGYVLSKLLLLIFPFKQKNWDRLVVRNDATGEVQGYKPPRYDVMAADLYIPVMAFVSYILLVGAKMGATRKFTPEVLTVTASSALFVTCINVLFLRLGLYLLNISMDQQGLQLSDLVSYSSYQYVLICILECLSFFVVSGATNDGLFTVFKVLVFVYMSVALSWFVLKSLRRVIVSTSSSSSSTSAVVNDGFQQQQNRKPRAYFLFVFVMLQVVSMWWLGY